MPNNQQENQLILCKYGKCFNGYTNPCEDCKNEEDNLTKDKE